MIAPICLFTYNRLPHTTRTLDALKKNFLAKESNLIIYADGPKNGSDLEKVNNLRQYLKTVSGFKNIEIIESNENKGLGASIIDGVTQTINEYGKAIIVEDDLITTPNFLDYMNQALNFYHNHEKIISICGYGLEIQKPEDYVNDFYLYGRASSWGWATWKDRWQTIDWEIKDWDSFKEDKEAIKNFNKNGSDMFGMLKRVMKGENSSWAIRFCYNQFKQRKFALTPFKSFVDNQGFDIEGTNTKHEYSRFKAVMDQGNLREFKFEKDLTANEKIQKECYKYHSLIIRAYSKLRYLIKF